MEEDHPTSISPLDNSEEMQNDQAVGKTDKMDVVESTDKMDMDVRIHYGSPILILLGDCTSK